MEFAELSIDDLKSWWTRQATAQWSAFLSWQWHRAYLSCFSDRTRVVGILDGTGLRAVAPLHVDEPGTASTVCRHRTDRTAVIIGDTVPAGALPALAARLGVRHIRSRALSDRYSRQMRALGAAFEGTEIACPSVSLDDGWTGRVSRRLAAEIRADSRRLRDLGAEHRVAPVATGGVARFLELTDAFRAAYHRPPLAASGAEADFYATVLPWLGASGGALFSEVSIGGEVVSALLAFRAGTRIEYYAAGHSLHLRRSSLGTVHLAWLLEWAAANGYSEVDLLRGVEDYKFRFGARPGESVWNGTWHLP